MGSVATVVLLHGRVALRQQQETRVTHTAPPGVCSILAAGGVLLPFQFAGEKLTTRLCQASASEVDRHSAARWGAVHPPSTSSRRRGRETQERGKRCGPTFSCKFFFITGGGCALLLCIGLCAWLCCAWSLLPTKQDHGWIVMHTL